MVKLAGSRRGGNLRPIVNFSTMSGSPVAARSVGNQSCRTLSLDTVPA